MRVIKKVNAFCQVQLTPDEVTCLYFAIMTQIGHTLTSRQRCEEGGPAHTALGQQLETELFLSNELDELREKYNDGTTTNSPDNSLGWSVRGIRQPWPSDLQSWRDATVIGRNHKRRN